MCIRDRLRVQHAKNVVRVHSDQKAAPAAVDVDQRQVEDGLFEIDRNLLFRSEWAGAADQIAGVAIGCGGGAWLEPFSVSFTTLTRRAQELGLGLGGAGTLKKKK